MAREEQDREDLLAEATALVERVEIEIDGQSVIVGFRRDGSASVYFDADPVYQFTAVGELRRAFVDGLMIKAVDGKLASLTRRRTAGEVQLVRHDLSTVETQDLLARLQRCLDTLRDALQQQRYRLVGQVPTETNVVARTRSWVGGIGDSVAIARSPRTG